MNSSNKDTDLIIRREIAERIKAARNAKGITQEKMAELLGMSHNNYARMENAIQGVTVYSLRRIGEILSISTDLLLYGNVKNPIAIDFDKYIAYAETFNSDSLNDMKTKIDNILELQKDKKK